MVLRRSGSSGPKNEQAEQLDNPGRRVWATAVVAILALGLVGAAATWATYRSGRDAAVDEVERIAVQSLVDATQYAEGRVDVLRAVAARGAIASGDPDAIGAALDEVPAADLGFDGGIAWLGDGTDAAAGAGPWSGDPTVLATVTDARADGSPLVSPAEPTPLTADSSVVVVVPTVDGSGDSNGALAGALSVAGLERVTTNVSVLRDADVFLIDRAGRTIAGPAGTELVDLPAEETAAGVEQPDGGSIGSSSSASARDPAGRTGRVVGVAAEPQLTGWTIVASRPADVAFADTRREVVLLLAAIVTLAVIGAAFALAVGRRLDRSADRLAAALTHERAVALELQHQLLPGALPEIAGLELAARYEPGGAAMTVGGDWYDVVVDANDRTCLLIGDVAGHGIRAAGVMGQMRAALHALAAGSSDLAELVGGLDWFVDDLPDQELATLAVAVVEPERDDVELARIGHLPPVRIGADGSVDLLWGVASPPVGVAAERRTARDGFAPGDTLLLFTDGLIERRDRSIDDQLELLRATCARVADGTVDELVDGVMRAFGPSDDDVAVLAARRAASR